MTLPGLDQRPPQMVSGVVMGAGCEFIRPDVLVGGRRAASPLSKDFLI